MTLKDIGINALTTLMLPIVIVGVAVGLVIKFLLLGMRFVLDYKEIR